MIFLYPSVKTLPGEVKRLSTTMGSHVAHENSMVKIDKDFPMDLAALIGCAQRAQARRAY